MSAWNGWYHCMGNTYGTWLPGDPRGFRTRHHREHIEGDYKSLPPPGRYAERYKKARSLMTRPPVYLSPEQQRLAVKHFSQSLRKRNVELIVLSIDRVHFHLLARFPEIDPRHYVGIAKKESSHYLKSQTDVPPGGLWATKSECLPIRDRSHQLRTVRYILAHAKLGAAIWFLPRDVARPHG